MPSPRWLTPWMLEQILKWNVYEFLEQNFFPFGDRFVYISQTNWDRLRLVGWSKISRDSFSITLTSPLTFKFSSVSRAGWLVRHQFSIGKYFPSFSFCSTIFLGKKNDLGVICNREKNELLPLDRAFISWEKSTIVSRFPAPLPQENRGAEAQGAEAQGERKQARDDGMMTIIKQWLSSFPFLAVVRLARSSPSS